MQLILHGFLTPKISASLPTLKTGPFRHVISRAMPTSEQRDYFERRSAEIRAMAQKALDPEIRATLQGMAESYDKLVEEADRISQLRMQLPV